ncbi:MAG TPA: hypothetical protein VGE39_25035 [Prosthecobacter sp.]
MPRSLFFIVGALSLALLLVDADEPPPASRPAEAESSKAAAASSATADQVNAERAQSNLRYYQRHLESCPEREVRCLWFLENRAGVGMMMTLNLKESRVDTVRDVYSHAKQNQKERELSHVQITIVEEVLPKLPPAPAGETEFAKGLHIAFWKAGKPCLISYPKNAVPRLVQRLYDIGGGYGDFTYVE